MSQLAHCSASLAVLLSVQHHMTNIATPPTPIFRELPLDRLRSCPDPAIDNGWLLDSIRDFGILCPLVVTPDPDGWHTVVDGHRRRSCARTLGFVTVPCVILETLTESEYLQRRFILNTMTKPWSQAETIAFFTRLGLPPSKAKSLAKMSGREASQELRQWLMTRELE